MKGPNMKRNSLLKCGLALLTASSALADPPKLEMPAMAPEPLSPAPEPLAPPDFRPWTISLEAGTLGAGGSVAWRVADHWGVRTGVDYFQYSDNGLAIGDLHYNAKARLLNEPLTLDLYPWKKHSFHVSLGVLFNQNELTGTAVDTGRVLGLFAPLNLKITQQPVNPYLSLGGNFFYFDRAHHWAMGGELGIAYTGDRQASLTWGDKAHPVAGAAWNHEQAQIKSWADQYQWSPVLKLNVSYSF